MLFLFLIAPSVGDAQVVATSITPTTGAGDLGTTVTHTGNLYDITGGTRPGVGTHAYLFHSFGDFSVGSGDIANFLNDTGLTTTNIIGRVTGGNISNIYGTIQTTGFDTANLFLVNPSGFVIGPTGSVNVGGSISFSTAHYLRVTDGVNSANFYTNPANDSLADSLLTVAAVVDFGFLTGPVNYGFLTPPGQNATITVQGSALSVPSGQSISLVGGNISIQGGTLPDGTAQQAHLSAPNGRIQLVNTASPGEIDVATLKALPNVKGTSFTSFGSTTLAPGSSIDVSGPSTVFVKGGQLVLSVNDATLSTTESPTVPGTTDAISLSLGSSIVTTNLGAEHGAEVQITGGTVQLDGAVVATLNSGDGGGGNISISASTVGLTNNASFLSFGGADLGTGAIVGSGNGGNVTVQGRQGAGSAADSVTLSSGSFIAASMFGLGHGGNIVITSKAVQLDALAIIDASASGEGPGGDIVLSVQQASLSGGAAIRSHTDFFGPSAFTSGTITMQGLEGVGSKADVLTFAGPNTGIFSSSFGTGNLGDIGVHAKTVSLTDRAAIQAGTRFDTGTAGNVTIDANSVDLSGGSRIASQAFDQNAGEVTITANRMTLDHGSVEAGSHGFGRGGDVGLNVGSISLANGARIDSSSLSTDSGAGDAGNVTITSSGAFTSDASTIATSAENAKGGDIGVVAPSVTLSNGTVLSASSKGEGNAGDITIQSGSTVLINNSSMRAEASQATGGQLTITVPEMVWLTNSQISTSVSGGIGRGGNITIDPQFVILQNSQIFAAAPAGQNGNISITAGLFLADPSSIVDASGVLNISGTLPQNVSGNLVPLSQQFSSAPHLLTNQCAADPTGQFSSFVQVGRDGVPQVPGALSPSPLSFLETLTSGSLGSPGPNWAAARLGLDSVSNSTPFLFLSSCRS